jgi:hypothetical protein
MLPVIIKKATRGVDGERRSASRTSAPRIAGAACPGIAASGAEGLAVLFLKTGADRAVPAFTDL